MMNPGIAQILGKRIKAVVIAEGRRQPHRRVFLTFDDGTYFDFHGETFGWSLGIAETERILWFIESGEGRIVRAYSEQEDGQLPLPFDRTMNEYPVADGQAPIFPTCREHDAWEAAKAVIAKAKVS